RPRSQDAVHHRGPVAVPHPAQCRGLCGVLAEREVRISRIEDLSFPNRSLGTRGGNKRSSILDPRSAIRELPRHVCGLATRPAKRTLPVRLSRIRKVKGWSARKVAVGGSGGGAEGAATTTAVAAAASVPFSFTSTNA